MAKQEWIVTIKITESEGVDTPNPWYARQDVEELIRHTFHVSGRMRDLDITSIKAEEDGQPYI